MKSISISLIFLFLACINIHAQMPDELTQAKANYKNKEYAKALPVFERELQLKPTDASLALWCGVSIVETQGDLKKAEDYLHIASKKNLPEAYLYLGDICTKTYRLIEAQSFYERYAKARPKERETTLSDRLKSVHQLQQFISRTEDIQIIDSLVIPKSDFLTAYALSADAGTLSYFKQVFDTATDLETVVYENGKHTKRYYAQALEGRYVMLSMDKLISGFGNEQIVAETNFGLSGDVNYMYPLTDGTTFYFAGKDEKGMGGYDIYVTRYNLNNDSYLTPELLNMPFNSPANDYLLVYDESKAIGWFATDRFQPEGYVCVYTFIPNDEVKLVSTDDDQQRENRAKLSSIQDTWREGVNYDQLKQLAKQQAVKPATKLPDFSFVINDLHTYLSINDFRSNKARTMYNLLIEKQKALTSTEKELDRQRNLYTQLAENKKELTKSILIDLEKEQAQLYQEVKELAKQVRNEEINSIR
ncbi:MAG: hypothetical protein RL662_1108 [Bacteroidota bacterium]|jgi:hypothetical protein